MKKKKAGEDGITNEAWSYAMNNLISQILKILNKVSKGRQFQKRWKRGVVTPIFFSLWEENNKEARLYDKSPHIKIARKKYYVENITAKKKPLYQKFIQKYQKIK